MRLVVSAATIGDAHSGMMELAMMPIDATILIGKNMNMLVQTRQRRRSLILFALCASVTSFAAMAADSTVPSAPTLLIVGKDSYTALGTTVTTGEALMALLKENKVTRVDVQYEEGGDYKRIGGVIYGLTRASIDFVHMNGRDVRKEVCADKNASPPPGYCAR